MLANDIITYIQMQLHYHLVKSDW